MVLFHLDKLRHCRLHAERFRSSGKDAADDRLNEAIKALASKTSYCKRLNTLVFVDISSLDEILAQYAKTPGQG